MQRYEDFIVPPNILLNISSFSGISGVSRTSGQSGLSRKPSPLEYLLQAAVLLAQSFYLRFLPLYNLPLRLTLSQAGSSHALTDTAFRSKFAIFSLKILSHSLIHLMTQADCHISQFFIIHALRQRTVVFPLSMILTETMQAVEAFVLSIRSITTIWARSPPTCPDTRRTVRCSATTIRGSRSRTAR